MYKHLYTYIHIHTYTISYIYITYIPTHINIFSYVDFYHQLGSNGSQFEFYTGVQQYGSGAKFVATI